MRFQTVSVRRTSTASRPSWSRCLPWRTTPTTCCGTSGTTSAKTGPSTPRKNDSLSGGGSLKTWLRPDPTVQPDRPSVLVTPRRRRTRPRRNLRRRSSAAEAGSLRDPAADRTWTDQFRRSSESRTTCGRLMWASGARVHCWLRGVLTRPEEVHWTSPTDALLLWLSPTMGTGRWVDGSCSTDRDPPLRRLTSSTEVPSLLQRQAQTVKTPPLMPTLPLQTCRLTSAMQRITWFSSHRSATLTSGGCTKPSSIRTTTSTGDTTTIWKESQESLLISKTS